MDVVRKTSNLLYYGKKKNLRPRLLLLLVIAAILTYINHDSLCTMAGCDNTDNTLCGTLKNNCCKKVIGVLSCKLTTPELQYRKATSLESLRKQVLEKQESENGYAFKFNGSDKMFDQLIEFIKTERQCCDFFTFNLTVTGDTASIWLEIVGPNGAKEFIKTELEL